MNLAGRINAVMTAFLALIDYPSNHFQCCENPSVVCIDGIVLSVESRRINLKTPWVDPSPLRNRFNLKEDRYLVSFSKDQKEFLRAFIRTGAYIEDLERFVNEIPEPLSSFILHCVTPDTSDRLFRLIVELESIAHPYSYASTSPCTSGFLPRVLLHLLAAGHLLTKSFP